MLGKKISGKLKDWKSFSDVIDDSGQLEKAVIHILDTRGKAKQKLPVQFNPSEYSISRSVRMSRRQGVGKDSDLKAVQALHGELAILNVTLHFDSYTFWALGQSHLNQITSGMENLARSLKNEALSSSEDEELPKIDTYVIDVFQKFYALLKFDHTTHQPPFVRFLWGDFLNFEGKITRSDVRYTMFGRNGIPVRAEVKLSILGEEAQMLAQSKQSPFESPDRTKERMLPYGDQLWMLANEEYGDPGMWKVIAESNGILNPRTFNQVAYLKVPSIR